MLKRAVRTMWSVMHVTNCHHIKIHNSWRLNERHYGALTGLSKEEAKVRFGEEMLHLYRRGFHVQPMLMKENHPFYGHVYDGRYDDEAVLPYGAPSSHKSPGHPTQPLYPIKMSGSVSF
mmetsp:Transcript_17781/g.46540  ORF Transcript_17781/g.46540 Transcript_17781/m.46540 type:complete len:119 (+) Transcript_17781:470-826(+)